MRTRTVLVGLASAALIIAVALARRNASAGAERAGQPRDVHRDDRADRLRELRHVPSTGRGRAVLADLVRRREESRPVDRRGHAVAVHAALAGDARLRRLRRRASPHRRADPDDRHVGEERNAGRRQVEDAGAAEVHQRLETRDARTWCSRCRRSSRCRQAGRTSSGTS